MKNLEHNAKNKKNKKQIKENKNETIDLSKEIVIGLVKKEEKNKKNKAKSTKNSKGKKTNNQKKKSKNKTKDKAVNKKKSKVRFLIFKGTSIIIVLATAVILFLMSSVFNIKEINIINNNKVQTQEAISLSGLSVGENMLKTSKRKIKSNLKQNPYVEDVKVHRRISGKVNIEIQERIPTYMIKFANAYAYINNQGYILETTDNALEVPIIEGIVTLEENIKAGNRLETEDLLKMQDVIKIMEDAKLNYMDSIITSIDISNSSNYILKINAEGKTVNFGNALDANIKFLKIKEVIEGQKNIEGEIYFQDKEKTIFREKV